MEAGMVEVEVKKTQINDKLRTMLSRNWRALGLPLRTHCQDAAMVSYDP